MDDNISREITLRIQKDDAYEDGNESSILENRQWRKSLPFNASGSVLLDLETSMELALLHSRKFQQQKEALYLSALDVTYERFQLGLVPFAGVSGQVSQGIDEDTTDFQSRAKAGFRGIAGTGTTWVASLANRLSIELSGGDVEVGGSLANLSITQPLLRGTRQRDVIFQFLVETVVLTGMGGLAGIIVGLLCELANRTILEFMEKLAPTLYQSLPPSMQDMTPVMVPWALPLVFCVAVLTGIVFGLYPARKAAQMDPVEALRHAA